MNILFFLTPKSEVAYIYEDYTMRQALEKMEYHRYSSIPIINKDGKYVGTITEGDLLWTIKNELSLDLRAIEDLISKSMNQNFVPVVDDKDTFIGIIKRRDIIEYCYDKIKA